MNTHLKRSLSLTFVVLYGVGAILGAGIYVLIGEVASAAGYLAPLSFLIAAFIAFFSALSYSELSAQFPRSAGEAVYIQKAFSQPILTGLVGLLVIFTGIVSAATLSTGVVGYFQVFFNWPDIVVILFFIALIGGIAIWGIEESAWVVGVITIIEVSGLLYIIFIADTNLSISDWSGLILDSSYDIATLSGIFLGSFLAFFAFIGFEDMVNIAEEVKNPEHTLPRAILMALILATLLYIVVIVIALSALTPEQLAESNAPLADVVIASGQSAGWIAVISLIAVINGAIVQLIMAARVIYGMASNNILPGVLAYISRTTSTPVYATLLAIAITLLLALTFPLGILAQATSIIVLTVFVLVNIALIRIRRCSTTPSDTIQFPLWVPLLGAVLCILMLLLKGLSAL